MVFTFDSFWGVFGWLGEFLDARIYRGLALATLASSLGLALSAWRAHRSARPCRQGQQLALALSSVAILAVATGFAIYNLSLVQHQGRYFFGALVPIAMLFSLGLGELSRISGCYLVRGMPAAAAYRRRDWWSAILPLCFVAWLALLSWFSLHRNIVPHLGPPL